MSGLALPSGRYRPLGIASITPTRAVELAATVTEAQAAAGGIPIQVFGTPDEFVDLRLDSNIGAVIAAGLRIGSRGVALYLTEPGELSRTTQQPNAIPIVALFAADQAFVSATITLLRAAPPPTIEILTISGDFVVDDGEPPTVYTIAVTDSDGLTVAGISSGFDGLFPTFTSDDGTYSAIGATPVAAGGAWSADMPASWPDVQLTARLETEDGAFSAQDSFLYIAPPEPVDAGYELRVTNPAGYSIGGTTTGAGFEGRAVYLVHEAANYTADSNPVSSGVWTHTMPTSVPSGTMRAYIETADQTIWRQQEFFYNRPNA